MRTIAMLCSAQSVPAAVEPVTLLLARRRVERRHTAQMRERTLGPQPLRVVTGRDQQRRSGQRVDALRGDQRGRDPVDEPCHLRSQFVCLGVELQVAPSQAPQRVAGHRRWRVGGVAGTHLRGHSDQAAKAQIAQLVAELVWGGDDQGSQLVGGLGAGLDR
jgi:hypothetical protein